LPVGQRYTGLTRAGPNRNVVWSTNANSIDYRVFDDGGAQVGSTGSISEGGASLSGTPHVHSFPNGPGLDVFIAGTDGVSHSPGVVTAHVDGTGAVTPGPCGNFTLFAGVTGFGVTDVANGHPADKLGWVGVLGGNQVATIVSNGTCTGRSGPFALGPNAGGSSPRIDFDPSALGWLVAAGIPMPNNDQAVFIEKVNDAGSLLPGFTPYQGPNAGQVFPEAMFLHNTNVVGVIAQSTPVSQLFAPMLDATMGTGTGGGSFLPSGVVFTVPVAAEQADPRIVVFANDDVAAGVFVLNLSP
jgi:hypothetical protein